ncbi:Rhamnogalacturonate lyase protein [Lasiodiplodia theobromae]|uniref:Rhamnogalacturonate lyase protein n=1 Tax=Lasiodiplodia theobromae TaxID=45133 RepID=UPI0015C3991A|nr:Rhamnogalacturonate lyase protein [Lasiodiplodia theobromae]KAF4544218.1 Rhamnogalacturonate lyase protein [Lasiodiplodia theobromae]
MVKTTVGLGLLFSQLCAAAGPFLQTLNGSWVIGNDLWNITQGSVYGKPAYYKGKDIIGEAVGHYVGYNGENNLVFKSAEIVARGENYIDVSFTADLGEFHWVIFDDLAGAYQYFVNRDLPTLGVFRSLFRLDNQTFPNGRTNTKDEPLPPWYLYQNATKVQDETWELANGTYITKYDWSAFIRDIDFYGVYGDDFGSWYIRPGGDYFNGNHLKQELIVHRESATGDAVQLNVVHGTHFMASSADDFPEGKIFGPWLWYLNDGSKSDASTRQQQEFAAWPYPWLNDSSYQSRAASVSGQLTLSDGRPAAGASVFLGENNSPKTTLDQGALYNYIATADASGNFNFSSVRAGTYALYAWADGGDVLRNVTSSYVANDIAIAASDSTVALSDLPAWQLPTDGRGPQIFQIGEVDRKATGFALGGSPYTHGLVDEVPANLTFTVGQSDPAADWYFAQSALGTWDVVFELDAADAGLNGNRSALLSVALAGFSRGSSAGIYVNGETRVGNLTTDSVPTDPSLYRSATVAGEWHLYEFEVAPGVLREGENTLSFVVERSTRWRGWLWDSIILEWA